MSSKSKIEWTDETWNPIVAYRGDRRGWHCEKVSTGCLNCYAESWNRAGRFRMGTKLGYKKALRGEVRIELHDPTLLKPLSWRDPRRVFVCSMTDLYGTWVPDEWIDKIKAIEALCPQHTFMELTKRPERAAEYLYRLASCPGVADPIFAAMDDLDLMQPGRFVWPIFNIWLGTSIEDQATADERIPHLLKCPAAVRFLSVEPLLGPVDLSRIAIPHGAVECSGGEWPSIDWVIVGGESGPKARPCNVEWIRSIVQQCKAAGVPVFVKQLGVRPVIEEADGTGVAAIMGQRKIDLEWPLGTKFGNPTDDKRLNGLVAILEHPKSGDPAEWPEDLRVREYPVKDGAP